MLTRYRDQIQERLDRLEKMEPVFEAMREALHAIVQERFLQRPESDRLNLAIDEGNAAALLADRASGFYCQTCEAGTQDPDGHRARGHIVPPGVDRG